MLYDDVSVGEAILAADPPKNKDKAPNARKYAKALASLDIKALEKDMHALMTANYSFWPNNADWNHYGPLFIRLAWHCSGPHRATDGAGGCSGGRLRFEPERSWPDNTNLDKARALVYPLKKKYGDALSWGDLYAFAGTAAIQAMGGPTKPFCFGRIDDKNGQKSEILNKPCKDPNGKKSPEGKCVSPWGQTTEGLIYVNPEGPAGKDGKPVVDPALSAVDVRDAFSRMGMNAMETVALIGGGHAFGKTHGGCAGKSPGDSPAQAWKKNSCEIWQGTCGDGKGANTITSGFEGPWTTTPTKWGNEYFKGLVNEQWEKVKGKGGHWQWQTVNRKSKLAGTMRLTADLALLHDPVMKMMVELFAKDQSALDNAFAHAWTQLTEGGSSWSEARKCQDIPTIQDKKAGSLPRPTGWAAWIPQPSQA